MCKNLQRTNLSPRFLTTQWEWKPWEQECQLQMLNRMVRNLDNLGGHEDGLTSALFVTETLCVNLLKIFRTIVTSYIVALWGRSPLPSGLLWPSLFFNKVLLVQVLKWLLLPQSLGIATETWIPKAKVFLISSLQKHFVDLCPREYIVNISYENKTI